MKVIIEGTPEQMKQAAQLTGNPFTPVAVSETGAIANFDHGPAIIEQLELLMDLQPGTLAKWDDLDLEAQHELALLTADSAPWAMDQKLHDTAPEDLSSRTAAMLRG